MREGDYFFQLILNFKTMALNYLFTRMNDVYTLKNLNTVDDIEFSLEKDNCSDTVIISSGNLPNASWVDADTLLTLPLNEDGKYLLKLSDGEQQQTIIIRYYLNLQKSLISDIKTVLCGCNCNGCNDCDDCNLQLLTLTKINTYNFLTNSSSAGNTTVLSEYFRCRMDDEVYCLLKNERYLGVSEVDNLYKILLSLLYLILYFTEVNNLTISTKEYVDSKFEFRDVSKCITKFGININDVKNLF